MWHDSLTSCCCHEVGKGEGEYATPSLCCGGGHCNIVLLSCMERRWVRCDMT